MVNGNSSVEWLYRGWYYYKEIKIDWKQIHLIAYRYKVQ